jgi:Kip1 ubiquitination-promoting complex protein 1
MALHSFHCLLVTFRALWECEFKEYPVVIPAQTFYDGSVNYYSIDRLGGVLSHLNRTLKDDLMRVLGADHPVITVMELSGNFTLDFGKLHSFL